uniref:Uncharacterized protein n=1 Tax=Heliothis virescens TaxID=7102 RepID=A0A2A4J2D2_HELVI
MTVDITEPITSTSKDLAEVSKSPLNSNTSDNVGQEIDAICEDSLPDDTRIEKLRANKFDYEALGMTVPEKLIHIPDTNMADKQTTDENIVQFEEIIDEGNVERAILSPTILQTNNNENVLNHK